MLCDICTTVLKGIVMAEDDSTVNRKMKAYVQHLRKDHHLTGAQIDTQLQAVKPMTQTIAEVSNQPERIAR